MVVPQKGRGWEGVGETNNYHNAMRRRGTCSSTGESGLCCRTLIKFSVVAFSVCFFWVLALFCWEKKSVGVEVFSTGINGENRGVGYASLCSGVEP